jgi:hypothetical protein
MTEFRVSPQGTSKHGHDRRIRLILWGAVLLLSGITLFSFYGARLPATNALIAVAVVTITAGAVGSAYFFAYKVGIERAKLKTVFLLTEKDLVRQQSGWPEVRIGLSEVKALSEGRGWLLVRTAEPIRSITIPDDVEGFNSLRSELIKHGPIIDSPRRFSFRAVVPAAVCFFCWALVFLSSQRGVVISAGGFALLVSARGSLHVGKLLSGSRKRFLLWAVLAATWAEALWIFYKRLQRL